MTLNTNCFNVLWLELFYIQDQFQIKLILLFQRSKDTATPSMLNIGSSVIIHPRRAMHCNACRLHVQYVHIDTALRDVTLLRWRNTAHTWIHGRPRKFSNENPYTHTRKYILSTVSKNLWNKKEKMLGFGTWFSFT